MKKGGKGREVCVVKAFLRRSLNEVWRGRRGREGLSPRQV